MSIPDLERSLSILNSWRLALGVLTAIAGVLLAMIQIQYARTDSQLSAERTTANLRQRERIATIESDTARALALLAWRRLNEHQLKIVSSGLREERIDRLQIAALAGDPEAQQFAADLSAAAREAGMTFRVLAKSLSARAVRLWV